MDSGGSAATGTGGGDAGAVPAMTTSRHHLHHGGHAAGFPHADTPALALSQSQNTRSMTNATSSHPPPSASRQAAAGAEEAQWSLKDVFWQGRECKIITQNQNGPCSLIALCNILLLRGELQITPPDRPVVSYSYLSQLLAEHLLIKVGTEGFGGEGLEAALSTLPRTQYGLDVDVGFDSITSFAATSANDGGAGELALFRLCGVPLVHGWLPDPADAQTFQSVQAAGSYNKATDLLVKGDEIAQGAVVRDRGVGVLAAKLASESSTSNGKQPEREAWSDEQRVAVRQALALQSFLETQSTQLTYHGLFVLAQEIPAGQPVALFRNSHLSVLYKRLPHEGVDSGPDGAAHPPPTLFTLATDASFLMEDEIVWESLVDVDGASSEFYDGKFHKSTMRQGDYVGRDADGLGGSQVGAGFQPNEDADYALAMQIHHNDQDRIERHQRRRNRQSQQRPPRQELSQGQPNSMMTAPPQPAFEAPNEVFTTMRYEVGSKQEEGDALVVSSLVPARLRDAHAEILDGLHNLSMGGAGTTTTIAASQSTNPFLNATEVGAAPQSRPTNPFLTNAALPTKHRLYSHVPLLDQHLKRLTTSAGAMCRAYSAVWSMPLLEQERTLDSDRILAAIETSLASSEDGAHAQGQVKGIRVAIARDGSIRVTQRSITAFPSTLQDGSSASRRPSVRLDFMPTRVRTMDLEPVVFNKTDARGFYEAAKQRVGADPSVLSGVRETDDRCFDVILWNDEQSDMMEGSNTATAPTRLVTESSLANVLVEHVDPTGGESRFVTPRTSTGMLDGLLRHWLVDKGLVEEEDVELDELVHRVHEGSAHIWLCNSLRGVWRVDLADPPRLGAAGPKKSAEENNGARVKKTRFSSFVRGASYKSANNGRVAPSSSGGPPPQAEQNQVEAVHNQVVDDLYGHRQDGSNGSGKGLSKFKGNKSKPGKNDKKDCIIM